VVYEVLAPGKEDVFRLSDPYGVTLRIHTKQIQWEKQGKNRDSYLFILAYESLLRDPDRHI